MTSLWQDGWLDGCRLGRRVMWKRDSFLFWFTDLPALPTVRPIANYTTETRDRFSDSDFTRLIINFSATEITYRMEVLDAGKFYHFSITESQQLCVRVLGGARVGSHTYTYPLMITHFCIKMLWKQSENWDSNTDSICCVRPVFSTAKSG